MSSDATNLFAHLQESLLGTFAFDRELGGGGMSRVFLADETALGRRVVVKVLAPDLAEGLSAERFTREVRLAARLQHPNIVPVFATGAAGGVPYYTMPYVEGESLRTRLDRTGALSTDHGIGVLRDVARALAHAHEQGIVHRDVKPDNILLSRDAAVVADFGIAKAVDAARPAGTGTALTQHGASVGTPAYMAPEQAAADPDVDHRADLYAWGVVAYELFAGRHPFAEKRTAQALIVAHLVEVPRSLDAARPGLPPALVALITRCLAKTPSDRPNSAREVLDVLGSLTSADAATVSPRASTPSVAVLPFINLSADPDNEYFSDGISEEVLSVLAQDAGLRVAARSSSFAFKGKQTDLRIIAEQLHVTTLLEGSVRRVGNRVRVTAQLVNAADGYHLWSDRFDRDLTDILAVQDEIANAIVTTLGRRLREAAGVTPQPADEAQPARRMRQRVSAEAYDEYLKGLYANRNQRGAGHEPGPAHFRAALALEPKFAAAHAGLAESHLWLALADLPPVETFAVARRHARRALALDPELADAHWMLGEVAFWHDWDVDAAKGHIKDALQLEPHHAAALMSDAFCHMVSHRRKEALEAAAAAVQVDPITPGTRIWFVGCAFNVGENDLAMREVDRLIGQQPSFGGAYQWRAMTHIMAGDLQRARADLEMSVSIEPPNMWGRRNIALVASQEGNLAVVRRERDELVRRSTREWVSSLMLGQMEQALGDYDAAFERYERAYQGREILLTMFEVDQTFRMVPPGKAPITDDPRWASLVQRVGIAP